MINSKPLREFLHRTDHSSLSTGLPGRAHNIQGTATGAEPKAPLLLCVSFTLCRQRQLLWGTRDASSLSEALVSPGNTREALVEQLMGTGIPAIKPRRRLQRDSPSPAPKATSQDYPGQFNYVWKQLQSFMGFEGCCSLDRRGERRGNQTWSELAETCDGRETPCHTHELKIRADTYKASFSQRLCFFITCHLEWGQCHLLHPTSPVP